MSNMQRVSSGTPWEDTVGYCRAVRVGQVIEVAGTTSIDGNGQIIGINDLGAQTQYIILKAKKALKELDAGLEHVIRTRIFTTDISRWEEIGKAHGEFFKEIKPVATMVEVSALIHPDILVEIEFSAIVP